MTQEHVYPLTIVATRYGGTYEGSEFGPEGMTRLGGHFAAFNCFPDDIAPDAFGGDVVAAQRWGAIEDGHFRRPDDPKLTRVQNAALRTVLVAFGDTPAEAYERLVAMMSDESR